MRIRTSRRPFVLGGLVLAIVAAVAIAGFHAHSHAHGELRVIDDGGNVRVLGPWRLDASAGGEAPPLASGRLRFELSNADVIRHDFVLLRTDRAAAVLPVARGHVDLANAGEVVGNVEAVAPGGAGGRTFTLPPGRYVLYCDIAGHYEGGMYYTLTVE